MDPKAATPHTPSNRRGGPIGGPAQRPAVPVLLQIRQVVGHRGSLPMPVHHLQEGDPQGKAGANTAVTVLFTIYKATSKLEAETTIAPKPDTVNAATGK